MKNLAINIPHINDATSFYRAANPLGQLRKRCQFLNGMTLTSWSAATVRQCDGAFFQRPFLPDHRGAIEMAKESGIKVWVDYDDYLLGVPTDNPTHQKYMEKEVQNNVKWILENADIVTTSTKHLKGLYEQFNKNIKVVPNAIDMDLKCFKERGTPGPRNHVLAWRGSRTHHRDAFTFARPIMEASRDKANADWQWHFIGDNLWFLTDTMPHYQTFITKPMEPMEYFKHIAALKPFAFHVPLADSDFNRSKSNIAWLEASFAGAAALVPDFEEWAHPGAIRYKDESEYMQGLYALMTGKIDVVATAKNSWDYIQDTLTLAKVNDTRLEVLMELFECDKADLGVK